MVFLLKFVMGYISLNDYLGEAGVSVPLKLSLPFVSFSLSSSAGAIIARLS